MTKQLKQIHMTHIQDIHAQIYRLCWKYLGDTHEMSNQEIKNCIDYNRKQDWIKCTDEEAQQLADIIEERIKDDHRLKYDSIKNTITLSDYAYKILMDGTKKPSEI